MELKRDRHGRPIMPIRGLWLPLLGLVVITGGLLAYIIAVRPTQTWVVLLFLVATVAILVAFVVTALRRNAAFVRTLSAEDRRRHYPVVPAGRLWKLLPIPVVFTVVAVWASIQDWLGLSSWNALVYAAWFPYSLLLFRSVAARRAVPAAAEPASDQR